MRRRILLGAALAAPALAQSPRPVRLIVPFPPGGPTDVFGRILAERLAARWPQPVIVDNRPGAGTIVGTQALVQAPPNGQTLAVAISAITVNPALRDDLPYDTLRDIAPVSRVANAHVALVANPALGARDLAAMVELARRTPGGLSYASPGNGTLVHLAGELLARRSGAALVHVPYPGSAPALTDVLAGRVPLLFDVWHSVRPHVEAGRLMVLGTGSEGPIPTHPNLPRIADTYPGFAVTSVFGVIAPGATPPALRERIAADIRAVLAEPETAARLADLGMLAVGSTPDEYGAFIAADIARWRDVVRAAGIRAG
ncbi:MAG: tripartite tricarboxylate transporter substrate binding protein [Alphaproteobacteria bacterium]|nr:tripartite tricarboxylate transporter substrate binding protein [Alphaproteobacteria bacterium]